MQREGYALRIQASGFVLNLIDKYIDDSRGGGEAERKHAPNAYARDMEGQHGADGEELAKTWTGSFPRGHRWEFQGQELRGVAV